MSQTQRFSLYLFLIIALTAQIFMWGQLRYERAHWLNIPPVPSKLSVTAFALGDVQFAYRATSLMLQNFGDSGGRISAFKDYDYERLMGWLRLETQLDPVSNYAPFLAAFYFSAINDNEKLSYLADYLHDVGTNVEGEKWRFLAQAIYLKRYKVGDVDTAYKWAIELATLPKPDMPLWTKQMPAFIKNAEGDKQAAYDILVEIMKSGKNKVPREEINAMTDYICDRILGPEAAPKDPLCQNR